MRLFVCCHSGLFLFIKHSRALITKKCLLNVIFIHLAFILHSQLISGENQTYKSFKNPSSKPSIDTFALSSWPKLGNILVSNNGKYVMYFIANQPVANGTLVIKGLDNLWSKEIIIGRSTAPLFIFSQDSKHAVFLKQDSLFILSILTGTINYVNDVGSFKHICIGKEDWIGFILKYPKNTLVVRNLVTDKQIQLDSVTNYSFSKKAGILVYQKQVSTDTSLIRKLCWRNLQDTSSFTLWSANCTSEQSSKAVGYEFDSKDEQLAFVIQEEQNRQLNNSIWLFRLKNNEVTKIVDSKGNPTLSLTDDIPKFTSSDCFIYYKVQFKDINKSNPNLVEVDVWSYRDQYLQSVQLQQKTKKYTSVYNIENKRSVQLDTDSELMIKEVGDFAIVCNTNILAEPWQKQKQNIYHLISLLDGSRRILKENSDDLFIWVSPNNKYIIYYDLGLRNYFSFDVISGRKENISYNIKTALINEDIDTGEEEPVGVAGWVERANAVLIYDNYDIWLVDPIGINTPINVTNKYGFNNRIKFRLVYEADAMKGLSINTPLLLSAFNTVNKYNGFFLLDCSLRQNPKKLSMHPALYFTGHSQLPTQLDGIMRPLKAIEKDIWIVKKQSAVEAPNFYVTHDFIKYSRISNIQPQLAYNWLKKELMTWKLGDGTLVQGIMYKPENLDYNKKYPIIFHYYEKMSHKLYEYPNIGYTNHDINIPWFVSRGYLVFTPDILFKIGNPGKSALNSILAAVKYISKFSYINLKKIGLQGHSFGGYETNYIITHSGIFAAASVGAGVVDFISGYNSIRYPGDGTNRQIMYELGQSRMGTTLWKNPKLFISNSPIFNVDRVKTPLLIMHNKSDANVPFTQGLELFLALRRLGKVVWMLQYDGEGHSVYGKKEALDYTYRLTQFFNHYLKNDFAPKWMTQGIPASMKGITDGLELDKGRKCNSMCIICRGLKIN